MEPRELTIYVDRQRVEGHWKCVSNLHARVTITHPFEGYSFTDVALGHLIRPTIGDYELLDALGERPAFTPASLQEIIERGEVEERQAHNAPILLERLYLAAKALNHRPRWLRLRYRWLQLVSRARLRVWDAKERLLPERLPTKRPDIEPESWYHRMSLEAARSKRVRRRPRVISRKERCRRLADLEHEFLQHLRRHIPGIGSQATSEFFLDELAKATGWPRATKEYRRQLGMNWAEWVVAVEIGL